ncbi:hypothetical protein EJ377_02710 [Chryseobacterium arthrosphaerae]|uniref:Uncharacterized protein n=1 Tax=Chryseobacterium arthrosphaerae TaxID=651561 RepID=A0A3S0Q798_9FLAO|nr:hypothetical protein EJ377_02710 [Chryseobacterium arthrosphaerae]
MSAAPPDRQEEEHLESQHMKGLHRYFDWELWNLDLHLLFAGIDQLSRSNILVSFRSIQTSVIIRIEIQIIGNTVTVIITNLCYRCSKSKIGIIFTYCIIKRNTGMYPRYPENNIAFPPVIWVCEFTVIPPLDQITSIGLLNTIGTEILELPIEENTNIGSVIGEEKVSSL